MFPRSSQLQYHSSTASNSSCIQCFSFSKCNKNMNTSLLTSFDVVDRYIYLPSSLSLTPYHSFNFCIRCITSETQRNISQNFQVSTSFSCPFWCLRLGINNQSVLLQVFTFKKITGKELRDPSCLA